MDTPIRLPRRHFLGAVLAGGAAAGLGQALLGQGVLAQALRAPSQAGPEGSGFDAADFGFRADGTAAANMQAVTAALTAAAGRPVTVTAAADFLMDRVQIPPGLAVDLRFAGPGRLDKRDGGGALTVGHPYELILPILAIARDTITVDGSDTTVTRLTVPDSTGYARGDVVRVVSEDIDIDAENSSPRRRGEHGIVAMVAAGIVYLADILEDDYTTSPRIGRLPQVPFHLNGLRILSALSSGASLISGGPLYRPTIAFEVEDHGRIAFSVKGVYQGHSRIVGSGQGDSSGSLGYLIGDAGSTGNHHESPRGTFWRHVVTTGFNIVKDPGSLELERYGCTRDMLVTNGIAHGSQGAPWDTHPGCRRSRFVGCESHGALRNASSTRCAVQIRGTDTRIEGLFADASHEAAVQISSKAGGTAMLQGIRAHCPVLQGSATDRRQNHNVRLSDIWLIDADVSVENAPSVLEDLGSAVSIHVQGGRLAMTAPATDYAQILSARGQGIWDLDDVEMVFGPGPARDLRFIRAADMAQVTGHAAMRITGKAAVRYVWLADGGTPVLMMKALWRQGLRPTPPLGGSWQQAYYAISDLTDPGSGITNVTDFSTWTKTIGALD